MVFQFGYKKIKTVSKHIQHVEGGKRISVFGSQLLTRYASGSDSIDIVSFLNKLIESFCDLRPPLCLVLLNSTQAKGDSDSSI